MFCLIKSGNIRIDKTNNRQKHVNFIVGAKRFKVSLAKRKRIMNIRRLPFWLLSHNQRMTRQESISFSSEHLMTGIVRHRDGDKKADEVLQRFESDKVDYWIRTEYLSQDFIHVMSGFVDISESLKKKINATWLNKASYEKNLGTWFDKNMLTTLYDSNPRWRDLEMRLYGGLVHICNICGETDFKAGPKGRMSATGKAPCCSNCNSGERDRAYRDVFECFKKNQDFSQERALQIGNDLSVSREWFGTFIQFMFDGDHSPNLIGSGKGDSVYDVIICKYIPQPVKDDQKVLHDLVQLLSPEGFLFLAFPAPIRLEKKPIRVFRIRLSMGFAASMAPMWKNSSRKN